MSQNAHPLIAEAQFAATRRELGPSLARIFSYYRQDGVNSITAIEDAMEKRDATAMVLPAHTLKGESNQFGAMRVAALAIDLENTARHCLEQRTALPDTLVAEVSQLRGTFHDTVAALERKVAGDQPPARTQPSGRPVFGRRVAS